MTSQPVLKLLEIVLTNIESTEFYNPGNFIRPATTTELESIRFDGIRNPVVQERIKVSPSS